MTTFFLNGVRTSVRTSTFLSLVFLVGQEMAKSDANHEGQRTGEGACDRSSRNGWGSPRGSKRNSSKFIVKGLTSQKYALKV